MAVPGRQDRGGARIHVQRLRRRVGRPLSAVRGHVRRLDLRPFPPPVSPSAILRACIAERVAAFGRDLQGEDLFPGEVSPHGRTPVARPCCPRPVATSLGPTADVPEQRPRRGSGRSRRANPPRRSAEHEPFPTRGRSFDRRVNRDRRPRGANGVPSARLRISFVAVLWRSKSGRKPAACTQSGCPMSPFAYNPSSCRGWVTAAGTASENPSLSAFSRLAENREPDSFRHFRQSAFSS